MHQLLLRLQVERDCAWERRYHRKIRGRLMQCLSDTTYESFDNSKSTPFTFSDPMPYRDECSAGDEIHLMVAAADDEILKQIATDLQRDNTMTAGAFVFDVRAATPIPADAGEPGTQGTITTASGIVATVTPDHASDRPTDEYWTERDHDIAAFRQSITDATSRLVEHETDLATFDTDPFDDYRHRKTYAVDVEVTPKNDLTVLASKWDLGYEVRTEHHQQVLNTVLSHGIGSKRSYGFGLLQTADDTATATTAQTSGVAHGD